MQVELTAKLVQDFKDLERVLKEQEASFSELALKYDAKVPTEQAELIPFLNGVQVVSATLSQFLHTLREVLDNEDVLAVLQKTPPSARGGRQLSAKEILPFYWTSNVVAGKLRDSEMDKPLLWQMTRELCVDFAYLGSSMTASSSLISTMAFFTEIFEIPEESDFWDRYLELAPRMLKAEHILGLSYISSHAAFLAATPENEIESNSQAISNTWWCQTVDSTPKDGAAYYVLQGLIRRCPDPTHPEAVARLRQIATTKNVESSVREAARSKLEGGG